MSFISWTLPPPGYVKINTDASIRSNGKVGFGIVVRDDKGRWITGQCGNYIGEPFDKHVGPTQKQIVQGELKAIHVALLVSQVSGHGYVIIESDSKTSIDLINYDCRTNRCPWLDTDIVLMTLDCKKLASKLKYCIFQHQKREGNFCADKLAAIGADSSEPLQCFQIPPDQIVPYLVADNRGFSFQRGAKLSDVDMLEICNRIPFFSRVKGNYIIEKHQVPPKLQHLVGKHQVPPRLKHLTGKHQVPPRLKHLAGKHQQILIC